MGCAGAFTERYHFRVRLKRKSCSYSGYLLLTVTLFNMRCLLIVMSTLAVAQARPGLLFSQPLQPIGVEYAPTDLPAVRAHPAVELNAESEALLPRELIKSRDFYDNPAIAADLAKESWFTNKEMQVVEREAENIPREKIYNIVKSAGFLDQH